MKAKRYFYILTLKYKKRIKRMFFADKILDDNITSCYGEILNDKNLSPVEIYQTIIERSRIRIYIDQGIKLDDENSAIIFYRLEEMTYSHTLKGRVS